MSQKQHTRSKESESDFESRFEEFHVEISEQLCDSTPDSVIDIIATQMIRAEDAKNRINEEGVVVRDMRGSVIQHPAIKIEIEAQKMVNSLVIKNKS